MSTTTLTGLAQKNGPAHMNNSATRARRPGLARLTRLEVIKSISTRSGLGVLVSAALLGPHWIPFFVLSGGDTSRPVEILAGLGSLTALLLLSLGMLSTAGEWSTRAIHGTFLAVPQRSRVLAAKAIALACLGAVGTAAGTVLSAGLLVAFDVPLPIVPTTVAILATTAGGAAYALIGVGVGAAVGHLAAALAGTYLTLFLVPPLLQGIWPRLLEYLDPHMALVAIAGGSPTPARVIAVAGWLVVALAAGFVVNRRRDVQ